MCLQLRELEYVKSKQAYDKEENEIKKLSWLEPTRTHIYTVSSAPWLSSVFVYVFIDSTQRLLVIHGQHQLKFKIHRHPPDPFT